jgi:hypothetical protein
MSIPVPDPDQWYAPLHGIPRPAWERIRNWIEDEGDIDRIDETWDAVAANWLRRVARSLGKEYRVTESAHFQLLHPLSEREGHRMLEVSEEAYTRVTSLLGELCTFHFGRVVAMRFTDSDHYYRYTIQDDGGDAALPMSGGMCMTGDFTHIICHSRTAEEFAPTLAHELSHFYTAHLPLPAWVNEGIAMTMEGVRRHLPTRESIPRHRAYWNDETIRDFWSGAIWSRAGEAFELSYELAAMMFEIIRTELSPPPAAFRAFVLEARRDDSGAAAAKEHLRVELAELVEEFLGPGDWAPRFGSDYD